jgi:hypothetical protein
VTNWPEREVSARHSLMLGSHGRRHRCGRSPASSRTFVRTTACPEPWERTGSDSAGQKYLDVDKQHFARAWSRCSLSRIARATVFEFHPVAGPHPRRRRAYAPRRLSRAAWRFCCSSGAGAPPTLTRAFALGRERARGALLSAHWGMLWAPAERSRSDESGAPPCRDLARLFETLG